MAAVYEAHVERRRGLLPLWLMPKKEYAGTIGVGQTVEYSGGKGVVELKLNAASEALEIASKAKPLQVRFGPNFFTGRPPVTEILDEEHDTTRTGRLRVSINVLGDTSSRLVLTAPEPKYLWIRPEQTVPFVVGVVSGKA